MFGGAGGSSAAEKLSHLIAIRTLRYFRRRRINMTPNHRSRFRLIAISFLGLLSVAFVRIAPVAAKPPGGSGNASFPHDNVSWSPDARFVANNVNDSPVDPRSPHSVFLTDMKTGQRWLLYSYPRKVDLMWSPASNALVINDWTANDQSQCLVFVLTPQRDQIDLREEFLKSRRPDREKKLTTDRRDYDDNYAHSLRWLNGNTLLFAFDGRSADRRHSFQLIYEYKLSNSFRLRKRVIG
jgi:hypothetical protein